MKISETVEHFMLHGLDDMRQSIDSLDSALFYLIVERVHLVIHMAAYKIQQGLSFHRSLQRLEDLEAIVASIDKKHAEDTFFYRFFEKIYDYSITIMDYMREHSECVKDYVQTFSAREMEEYRRLLKAIDYSLSSILVYRFDVVYQVGLFKKKNNMPPMSPDRWQKLIKHKRVIAVENSLDADFIESLFDIIHEQSLAIESKLISKSQESP